MIAIYDEIEIYQDEAECCPVCGAELEWIDCPDCGGDGEIDCYGDDPLWYGPGDTKRCSECKGVGGWLECPRLPHEKHP